MLSDHNESDWGLTDRIRYAFRERELYIRSDGTVRFVVIKPWALIFTACVFVACAGWLLFTTTSFILKERSVAAANARTQSVRVAYEDRIASIHTQMDGINERLMLDQDAYLDQVDELREEFAQLLQRHRRLEIFFEQGWLPTDDPEVESEDPDTDGEQREGWWRRNTEDDFRTADEAERPLKEVRMIFAEYVVQQHTLLDSVIDYSEERAHEMRTLFRRLGLDPDSVVAKVDDVPDAIGGPLLPVQQGADPRDSLDERILEAHKRFDEAERLRHALSLLPTDLPMVDGYSLTSGFGFRRDPFTDVMAMHAGLDLRAPEGSQVIASAGGLVVRAEHADAYGKVIDIEHDFGITTRYAHLSRIDVELGERVEAGQGIGLVGTTGRSTGPHLHYETRVNGRPIDPYEFIRVAQDVLQEEN